MAADTVAAAEGMGSGDNDAGLCKGSLEVRNERKRRGKHTSRARMKGRVGSRYSTGIWCFG